MKLFQCFLRHGKGSWKSRLWSPKRTEGTYKIPCDSGVTRFIVSGRTGKDWLKIKRDEPEWSTAWSLILCGTLTSQEFCHLADVMLLPVWDEALKWRARKRCFKAPCAAIAFIWKFCPVLLWSKYFWHFKDIYCSPWLCHITPVTCQQSFRPLFLEWNHWLTGGHFHCSM